MFSCTCCEVPRSFSVKKSLYRHQRNTGTYEDPRAKDARERREAYARAPKSCEACGIEFAYEDVVTGSKVKYCSRSCAAVSNNRDGRIGNPHKRTAVCEACLNPLPYTAKKFCNVDCQTKHGYDTYIESWLQGGPGGTNPSGVSVHVRKFLHEERGSCCWECGWDKVNPTTGNVPVQVDHIDGNPNNHHRANLRLICPNCHSLTPTYMALNRGNGRHYRRQRYAEGKSS